jgi:hypothetical protein
MAETVRMDCAGKTRWHWADIHADLVGSGVLDKSLITVDPVGMKDNFFTGYYDQTKFSASWFKDAFFLLSMETDAPMLVKAFSVILEYEPFVSYVSSVGGLSYITYEWDKQDAEGRLSVIRAWDDVSDIKIMKGGAGGYKRGIETAV